MKTELNKSFLARVGFTPCFNFVSRLYPKNVDRVLGRIWSYCNILDDGKCYASIGRIAKELGISYSTVNRAMSILVSEEFITDLTPELRNHPHTYVVNEDRILEAAQAAASSDLTSADLDSNPTASNLTTGSSELHSTSSILHGTSSELTSDSCILNDDKREDIKDNTEDNLKDLEEEKDLVVKEITKQELFATTVSKPSIAPKPVSFSRTIDFDSLLRDTTISEPDKKIIARAKYAFDNGLSDFFKMTVGSSISQGSYYLASVILGQNHY